MEAREFKSHSHGEPGPCAPFGRPRYQYLYFTLSLPKLFEKCTGVPIARFERSFRDFRSRSADEHIQVPAQIIFSDARTTRFRDMALVAFFLQERKRRQEDVSGNKRGIGWNGFGLGVGGWVI
jgi:hypothetical protein